MVEIQQKLDLGPCCHCMPPSTSELAGKISSVPVQVLHASEDTVYTGAALHRLNPAEMVWSTEEETDKLSPFYSYGAINNRRHFLKSRNCWASVRSIMGRDLLYL